MYPVASPVSWMAVGKMTSEKEIRLLLVEACKGCSDQVRSVLKRVGFSVEVALGLSASLTTFDPNRHQLVVIHASKFDFDTVDFLKKWKEVTADTPFIFLHTNDDRDKPYDVIQFDTHGRVVYENSQPVSKLPQLIMKVLTQKQNPSTLDHSPHMALSALQKQNNALARLNSIGQKMAATHDPNQIIVEMLENATSIIRASEASLWVWENDETRDFLICKATSNREIEHKLRQVRLEAGEGVAGWVVQHQLSTISFDTHSDPRFTSQVDRATGFETQSILAVPLRFNNDILGVLEVLNKQNGMFSSDDAVLVETLATSAAIALENASLMESLRRKTMELEVRNRDLDAFAHTVAHDLRKPLNLMMNHFDLLTINVGDSLEGQDEFVDGVNRNMDKMNEIINSMLLLASLSDAEIDCQPIDMVAVVAESFAQLETQVRECAAEITLPQMWPDVVGYAPWIERVWVNYISNALKYGGKPPMLTLGYDDGDPLYIKFWIEDNGDGLLEEDMPGLFKPFPTFRDSRGHGLGLSIVKRIVDRMGGQVGAVSTPGKGSCFSFTLPRQ